MTTKIYGIYGRTQAILRIPTNGGKAYVEVSFERGIPNGGPNYRPATFATADPIVQDIMERSPMFNNVYKLFRVVTNESATAGTAKTKKETKTAEAIEGVETREEVIEYLKSRGAKASNLVSNEAILKYAEKIGVTFPNVTL